MLAPQGEETVSITNVGRIFRLYAGSVFLKTKHMTFIIILLSAPSDRPSKIYKILQWVK